MCGDVDCCGGLGSGTEWNRKEEKTLLNPLASILPVLACTSVVWLVVLPRRPKIATFEGKFRG